MKIKNLIRESVTVSTPKGPITVLGGETSDDLDVRADDSVIVANLHAGNIEISGGGSEPERPEPAAPTPVVEPQDPAG